MRPQQIRPLGTARSLAHRVWHTHVPQPPQLPIARLDPSSFWGQPPLRAA
jgi:hypothetical protein